jgi:serine/threonine protein kinase
MASVHDAIHVVTGRRLAVKFLRREFSANVDLLARFEREARAAGALEHENVISVIDFGYAARCAPYMVMEHLSGEDLSGLLAREAPLLVPAAVDIAIQACRGLAATHAAGIVHRDVKPENLFLCHHGDGTKLVKLLDFGIAKLTHDLPSEAGPRFAPEPRRERGLISFADIDADLFMGTPDYMSPEQMMCADNVDGRSDVYSLGVILFEMLSGEKPHPGESCIDIVKHVLTQEPTPIETLRGTLPRDLAAIVHRALLFDPGERFGSALELAAALAPFAGSSQAIGAAPESDRPTTPAPARRSSSTMKLPMLSMRNPATADGVDEAPPIRMSRIQLRDSATDDIDEAPLIRTPRTGRATGKPGGVAVSMDAGESVLVRFGEGRARGGGAWNAKRSRDLAADLNRFRAALAEAPSGEVALEAAHYVARAIDSGLVQPAMIERMAAEARRFLAQAQELAPERSDEVTARWARLEIAALHPEAALEILDRALPRARQNSARQELAILQEDAWFASYAT